MMLLMAIFLSLSCHLASCLCLKNLGFEFWFLNCRLGMLTLLKSMNTSVIPWKVNLNSFRLRSDHIP